MITPEMGNGGVLAEIGRRLRRERLNADVSQLALATAAGLSLKTVQKAEAGKNPTLDTLISLLRALGRLSDLEAVLPDTGPSPIQLARLKGRVRQRASGSRKHKREDAGEWQW